MENKRRTDTKELKGVAGDMKKDMGSTTRRATADPRLDEPWCCYTDKKTGQTMFSGLTCMEWGAVTTIFLGAYILLGCTFAALLAAQFERGTEVLWAYLAAFIIFMFVLIVVVILGEINRTRSSKRNRAMGAQKLEEDVKASDALPMM